jgi:hypothetical protein
MNTWQRLFPISERPTRELFVDSSPLIDEVEHTYMENPESFGHQFNLIRAVEEYGPQRVESIRQELAQMEVRQNALTKEMQTLEKLIAVTKPSAIASQDIAWAPLGGYAATALGNGFDID